jgi:hypothetical protein
VPASAAAACAAAGGALGGAGPRPPVAVVPDALLAQVAAAGGVVGVSLAACVHPHTAGVHAHDAALGEVAERVVALTAALGADHVAIGSDWDSGVVLPAGLDARGLPLLTAALRAAGMSPADVEAVMGGSVLRVLRAIMPSELPARAAETAYARHLRLHGKTSPSSCMCVRYTLLVQLHHDLYEEAPVCFAAAAPIRSGGQGDDELRFRGDNALQRGIMRVVMVLHDTEPKAYPGAAMPDAPDSPLLLLMPINPDTLSAHAWLLREHPDGRLQVARWAQHMAVQSMQSSSAQISFGFFAARFTAQSTPEGAQPRGLCRHGPAAAAAPPYVLLDPHMAHRLSVANLRHDSSQVPLPPPSVVHAPYFLGGEVVLRLARLPDERM